MVDAAKEKAEFARDLRDRHIAHNDLATRMDKMQPDPLAAANREQVHEALSALQNVFKELEQRYMCQDTVFIGSGTPHDAFDLLSVLYFGIKEQACANERIRAGQATEDDYPALYFRDYAPSGL
jgi:AbiU2